MEEEAGRADAVVIALPGKQVAGDDAAVEESLPFADPAKRAEMVKYATRALFAVAVAYIMTLIQAIPISMNFQVTGTSIPTSVTTLHLGLGAFAFRIAAVLFGNAIGVASDMCGRRPWLFLAAFVYIPCYVVYLIVWYTRPSYMQTIPDAFARTLNVTEEEMLVPCRQTPTFNFSQVEPWAEMHDCRWHPSISAYYFCYILLGVFT